MQIHFVAHGDESLASHRMRVLKPAELLSKAGHEVTISDKPDQMVHWNIFGKHLNNDLNNAKSMQGVTKIAFDVVDDHFEGQMGSYYQEMCGFADVVLTPSDNMKSLVEAYTHTAVEVVKEPITMPYYKAGLWDIDSLMWFGHISNISPLVNELESIPDRYDLEVITNAVVEGGDFTSLKWRQGLVEERLKTINIVLLPIDLNRRGSVYKSTNRAVDALRAGKVVITNSVDVYGELEDYIIISDTIAEGLEYYSTHYSTVLENVQAGQKYVQENYNDIKVLEDWNKILTKHIELDPDFRAGTEINIVEGDNKHA